MGRIWSTPRTLLLLGASLLIAGCVYDDYPVFIPVGPPVSGGSGQSGADVTINIVGINGNMSFSPNPAVARAGQTVAWYNGDPYNAHRILQDNGGFDAGAVASGETTAPVTLRAGTITYHCSIHPSMVGTVTVTP